MSSMTIGERIDGFIEAAQLRWHRLRYQWRWFWMTPSERIAELDRQHCSGRKGLLWPSRILREMEQHAHSALVFNSTLDRKYDPTWAATGEKLGASVDVRRPPRYHTLEVRKTLSDRDQLIGPVK